jgi:chitodextrinase
LFSAPTVSRSRSDSSGEKRQIWSYEQVKNDKNSRTLRLGITLVALSVLGVAVVKTPRMVSATPTGTYFDHIVIIAMENQPEEILGTSSTPFLNSLMAAGSTLAQDNHYSDNVNCSFGCYVEFTSGLANGGGYGDGACSLPSSCISATSIVDQLSAAGLTWQAYCEAGCPRGDDHFPFGAYLGDYQSSNLFYSSSVSTSDFIAAANSASPPNYLWYTPTDQNNMHDGSISAGDSYLQNFLVGSGTVASPATGSLLASHLFTSDRTLLWIWFDECGESNGGGYSCDSNSNAANVEYGPSVIKPGYTSQASYNEFSELAMIEDNWGLGLLGSAASASPVNDIFTSGSGAGGLSASFTFSPTSITANKAITFSATATGGTAPYSFSWNFGDGNTATGASPTHTYTTAGTYTITMTTTDNNGLTTMKTQQVTVGQASQGPSGSQPSGTGSSLLSTLSLLMIGLVLGGAAGATLYLAKYRQHNRLLQNMIENRGSVGNQGHSLNSPQAGTAVARRPRSRVRSRSSRFADEND